MRIAIIGENSVEFIQIVLSIWNSSNTVVLIDWRMPFLEAKKLMYQSQVTTCYIQEGIYKEISLVDNDIQFLMYKVKYDGYCEVPLSIYQEYCPRYDKEEAVILFSSGTTNKAKGIILSHYAINNNVQAIIDYMKPKQNDCIFIVKS